MNLMAQVIEGQQTVKEHQLRIGQSQIVFARAPDVFQLPDHVVGEVSDSAGGERRQAGARLPDDAARNSSLTHLENIALAFFAQRLPRVALPLRRARDCTRM